MPNIAWVYRRIFAESTARAVTPRGLVVFALLVSGGYTGSTLSHPAGADEVKPGGSNAYQAVTGDDLEDDKRHWDKLFSTSNYVYGKEPAAFLRENTRLLPVGKVLDIAMGEGRNAVYLAKKGFRVEGVDISEVALRKAKRLAKDNHVKVATINADLTHYSIRPESYDVILNIDYLQRDLIPKIKRGLKKGGIVVFENYTVDQLQNTQEQMPREYLLEKGELKEAFRDFQILVYHESNDGKDARASLVAKKIQR